MRVIDEHAPVFRNGSSSVGPCRTHLGVGQVPRWLSAPAFWGAKSPRKRTIMGIPAWRSKARQTPYSESITCACRAGCDDPRSRVFDEEASERL